MATAVSSRSVLRFPTSEKSNISTSETLTVAEGRKVGEHRFDLLSDFLGVRTVHVALLWRTEVPAPARSRIDL